MMPDVKARMVIGAGGTDAVLELPLPCRRHVDPFFRSLKEGFLGIRWEPLALLTS
jgi:hypothetical protein